MARVALTVTVPGGNYDLDGVELVMTAADATNDHEWALQHGDSVIAQNTGAGARTVTITSVAINGRTGNMTRSLAAGAFAVFGPFKAEGWRQADSKVYLEAEHAEVKLGILRRVNP